MPSDFDRSEFVGDLKAMGAAVVREKLSRGEWLWPADECAEEWLRHEDDRLKSEAALRDEARSEETLAIAKEANRFASEANLIARSAARWAMWAAIIAAIAAAIATKDQIIALIFSHP